jgi:hypothetical protein
MATGYRSDHANTRVEFSRARMLMIWRASLGLLTSISSLMDRRRHSLSSLHAFATLPKPWTVEPMLSGYRVIDDNGSPGTCLRPA